ncbi:Mut7-C ubiquitin/RNAse domain-containing protein [Pontibacter sp. FD36]|uniref:Mut7-C RNAse domain-containing protein n=1 Tax=Pontibacter sp. FD36 TaxID=2789860 RepID=UPI0018AA5BDA|nr:Mut7-C RNAse domain-containing protein [Pontibacter sp. FD36]MBF8964952.1 Mut7-C ubiquitin/RNAse domain-containing protein [Pontibacter sp. FD36]
MSQTAFFKFHGSLNDFLRPRQRNTSIRYTYAVHQTVKDVIEAIGVPHVEVREVLVNGAKAAWTQRLQENDQVEVYPFEGGEEELLADKGERRFVLDVHLGTLARSLRMLGFDTVYRNDLHDTELVQLADESQRILLTRDVNLLKHKDIPAGYWLRSQHTEEQLKEVVIRYKLHDQLRPFTRCMVCNGNIVAVDKQEVLEQLPPKTKQYFDEFYQCQQCKQVYWKGSHYERMMELVHKIERMDG